MTIDVSRLGIIVESKGITEAKNALVGGNGKGGLYAAADKTEQSVKKLTDSLSKLMGTVSGTSTAALNKALNDVQSTMATLQKVTKDQGTAFGSMSNSASRAATAISKLEAAMAKLAATNTTALVAGWSTSLQGLQATMAQLANHAQATTRAIQQLTPAIQRASGATNQAAAANSAFSSSSNVVANTLKAMFTAATAYQAINFGMSLVKQADSWVLMEAKLRNATGSLNNARVAQEQMFELSQRLRVPLEESVRLYTRLAPAMQKAGKSSEYAKNMVEGISTALQLSGATGGESASVMLQLSQSFSSGVLNGAEFNAVAENGSVLMRALEKSTGKTTYELKKMGSEGKLSMDVVGKAILESLPIWRAQFDLLPVTFEGAMTRLKNAWTKAVGQMGQSTGFNKQLSDAVLSVEKLIPQVAQGLGNAFIAVMQWIEKNKEKLGEILDQTGKLVMDVLNIAAAVAGLTGNFAVAGEKASVLGKAIEYIRWTIAAITDGVKVIAAAFVNVGADITRVLVLPGRALLVTVMAILGGFESLFEFLAGAARVAGLSKLASGLDEITKSIKGYKDEANGFNRSIGSFLDAGKDMANGWVEDIIMSQGALHQMMNEADKTEKKISTIADLRKMERGEMNASDWNANPNPKARVDDKAAKAAAAATKKYNDTMEELNAKLKQQQQLQENLAKSGLDYDKVGPAMKEFIKQQEHLTEMIGKGASAEQIWRQIMIVNRAKSVSELETENERMMEHLRLQKSFIDQQKTATNNAREQALEAERKLQTYGMEKGAIEALELAEARRAVTAFELLNAGQVLNEQDATKLALMKEQVSWLERLADANSAIGSMDATRAFDKLFDDRKAERFGQVLAEGFGEAGKSLGKLMNSLDKYSARQAKIAAGRKELLNIKDANEYAKRADKLASEETESRLASYADMAGAAKGFFKEGTAGYKAMEGAEKAFRLFQMAMQVKSFLQEIGLLQASTAATVASNTAKMASDQASAASGVASAMVQGQASATAGVANQAMGDPYSAFARMAAMAALMAALGFAVSGGGGSGKNIAKARQEAQGTGTVFGDAEAKSESISKSIEILSKNSDIALRYSSGMLRSLQSIEQSLTGAVSGVVRSGGVTGKGFNNTSGLTLFGAADPLTNVLSKLPVVGKFISSLFGSTKTLKDSGLMGSNQSIANILQSGFNVQGYQDVQTKKKAFGFTYSDKTKTTTTPVDPAISREFGNVVEGMVDSLVGAAEVLGFSGDAIRKKLEAVNIDIGKISLKDLSTEEVQKQLEAVFSAIGDKLATVALPSVVAFQKAGEGLLETAVRVASGVESANYELEKLGINAVNYADLVNKNGDVGSEIVRQSILAIEKGTGIGAIISTLSGDANEIADTYKQLVNVQTALQGLGIANEVSRDLIRAAGGLDKMQDSLEAYTNNFFSDSEQNTLKLTSLRKEFDKLGLAMPSTKAGFRALVEQLSASGAKGQELALKVIGLSEAFADLSDSTSTLIEDARGALQDAYDAEAQSLQDVIDKMGGFSDSLKDFKKTLATGDLSTLDVAGKYSVEKANYDAIVAKALAGDQDAIAKYQDAAQSFLEASRAMNASGMGYTSDFDKVMAQIDLVQKIAEGQKSEAQQQLDALNKQVAGLLEINTSVLSVEQAIKNLTDLMTKGVTAGTTPDGKATIMPVDAPSVTTAAVNNTSSADTANLVAQVAALTAEVQTLRQEQAAQAAAQAAATIEAAQMNANQVSDSLYDASSMKSWNGKVQQQIN